MNLSPHFTLAEMCTTSKPFPNVPGTAETEALRELCVKVLEPWRAEVGPIGINSGFRSPAVNTAVGGEPTSDHLKGLAADCKPSGLLVPAWDKLVELIRDHWLPVDQAIIYVRPKGGGWIHVSHRPTQNRGEMLVCTTKLSGQKVYTKASVYKGPLILS